MFLPLTSLSLANAVSHGTDTPTAGRSIAGRSERDPLGMLTEGRHSEADPSPGGLPLGGRAMSESSTKGRRERALGGRSETVDY